MKGTNNDENDPNASRCVSNHIHVIAFRAAIRQGALGKRGDRLITSSLATLGPTAAFGGSFARAPTRILLTLGGEGRVYTMFSTLLPLQEVILLGTDQFPSTEHQRHYAHTVPAHEQPSNRQTIPPPRGPRPLACLRVDSRPPDCAHSKEAVAAAVRKLCVCDDGGCGICARRGRGTVFQGAWRRRGAKECLPGRHLAVVAKGSVTVRSAS